MRAVRSANASLVGVGMVILWAAAAGLASRLPTPATSDSSNVVDDQSVISRVFGTSREIISKQFFAEADRYFHKGVSSSADRAFENHLFIQWGEAITPMDHDELADDDTVEILPWLRLATSANPNNIEAYSTAAYWLERQGNIDMARMVLEEACRKNPGDYRVPLSLGKLYYRTEDHNQALEKIEQARLLWPSGEEKDEEQAQIDLASIFAYSAGSFEVLGRQQDAIASFRELLYAFPGRYKIQKRLEELEKRSYGIERSKILVGLISEIDKQIEEGTSHLSGGAGSNSQDKHVDCHDHDHHHNHDH